MLKISKSIESITQFGEAGVGFGDDSRAGHDGRYKLGSEIDDNKVGDNKVEDNKVRKKAQKTSKSKKLFKSKKTIGSDFSTPGARLAFTKLRQMFVKTSIFYHFDSKHYIWVETDILGYVIGRVFNQLISNNLSQ